MNPWCLEIGAGEKPVVPSRVAPPRVRPGVQVRKFYKQDGCLDRVKAEVATYDVVIVLGLRAVGAHYQEALIKSGIVGYDHASIAGATEIFAGKETKAAHRTDTASFPPLICR